MNFNTTFIFLKEYLYIKDYIIEKKSDNAALFSRDFNEYILYDNDFGQTVLKKYSTEICEYPIYEFHIPKTKNDLLTILIILDENFK